MANFLSFLALLDARSISLTVPVIYFLGTFYKHCNKISVPSTNRFRSRSNSAVFDDSSSA
ncbi:hypothetical protein SK128_001895 [Halocaridina rubra]|uniref:Uncharacterized protein n=1 Tax=Halocaridina rubra TaxID=373956 RepID=A0AAN8XPS3_HALRR